MRNFLGCFFLAYYAANALATIALIGKKRDPITPGTAVGMVIIFGLLAWAIYVLWSPA